MIYYPAQWIAFSFHNLDSRTVETNFIAIVVMMLEIKTKAPILS